MWINLNALGLPVSTNIWIQPVTNHDGQSSHQPNNKHLFNPEQEIWIDYNVPAKQKHLGQ